MDEEPKHHRKGMKPPPPPPITLEELQLKIYHPPPSSTRLWFGRGEISDNPNESSAVVSNPSLSFIPWTLQQSTNKRKNAPSKKCDDDDDPSSFPTISYLDLRRQQNCAWADDRLSKGNEQFYLDPIKADTLYQEGLDLVHDHIELLVAQGKLWMLRRNRPQAAKTQLQQCLRMDPGHKAAKELLDRLERQDAARRGGAPKRLIPQTRESSSAFQNALMERNLAMDSTSLLDVGKEEELDEERSADSSSGHKDTNKQKKKKKRKSKNTSKYSKKKHDKKKRRKRKRYYYSSSDDDSSRSDQSSSVDDLDDKNSDRGSSTGRRRERQRKKRKRKRRRRRHDSDLSSDSDEVAVAEPTSSPGPRDDERNRNSNNKEFLDSNDREAADSSTRPRRQDNSNHNSINSDQESDGDQNKADEIRRLTSASAT